MLVSCLTYSYTLRVEAKYPIETSVDFQRATRLYILEERLFLMTSMKHKSYPFVVVVVVDDDDDDDDDDEDEA
jgi:hypothetical protein